MTRPSHEIASAASRRAKTARSEVRRRIRSGEFTIPQVMASPPDELAGDLIPQVVMLAPMWGKARLEALGLAATRDGINLVVALGRATPDTRRWVAQNVAPGRLDGLRGVTFDRRIQIRAGQDGTISAADALVAVVREHHRRIASTDEHPDEFGRADGWLWDQAERVAREIAA